MLEAEETPAHRPEEKSNATERAQHNPCHHEVPKGHENVLIQDVLADLTDEFVFILHRSDDISPLL